jgi:hypothetical protein
LVEEQASKVSQQTVFNRESESIVRPPRNLVALRMV